MKAAEIALLLAVAIVTFAFATLIANFTSGNLSLP